MRKLQFYLLNESLFYPSAIDSPKLIFSGCYIFSDSFADSSTFTIDTDLGLVIEDYLEKRGRTEKARLQVFLTVTDHQSILTSHCHRHPLNHISNLKRQKTQFKNET